MDAALRIVRHATVTQIALQTMIKRFTTRVVDGGEGMAGGVASGQLSASAPTRDGWLYVSGALTPYDLENLCDQIAALGRRDAGDVHVELEVGGSQRDSPELRALAQRMKRLRRQGVVVHVHSARRLIGGPTR
jgi:hypothetical protein